MMTSISPPLLVTDGSGIPIPLNPLSSNAIARRLGPGGLMSKMYGMGETLIKPIEDRVTRAFRMGPRSAADAIAEIFEKDCDSVLNSLYDFHKGMPNESPRDIRKLEHLCRKLIRYADQRKTNLTLLQTFECIIMLVTKYPGIRCMLLHANKPDVKEWKAKEEELERLLRDLYPHRDVEEQRCLFFKNFALVAISCTTVSAIIEQTSPCVLGRASEQYCTIQQLLNFCGDSQGSEGAFLGYLAVRFLAKILQRPTFWKMLPNTGPDANQVYIAKKMCERALVLVEDITSSDNQRIAVDDVDVEGTDDFLRTLLAGLYDWVRDSWKHLQCSDEPVAEFFRTFKKLVTVLQSASSELKNLLPFSTKQATALEFAVGIEDISSDEEVETGVSSATSSLSSLSLTSKSSSNEGDSVIAPAVSSFGSTYPLPCDGQEIQRLDAQHTLGDVDEDDIPNYFIERDDRVFHADPKSPYPLPCDGWEIQRLDTQHSLLREIHGHNYIFPDIVQAVLAHDVEGKIVVDLAHGTGRWTLEMGEEFPHVQFYGLEIVPMTNRDHLDNVQFELDSEISQGTRFEDASVTMVHARTTDMTVRNYYQSIIIEAARILRRRGLFLAGEWAVYPTFVENAPHPDPAQMALVQYFTILTNCLTNRGITPVAHNLAGLVASSNLFAVHRRDMWVPIGPWDPARQNFGNKMRIIITRLMSSTKPLLLQASGMTSDQIDQLFAASNTEMISTPGLAIVFHSICAERL
ncbi:hypothetical protein D9758_010663 [Tetrapyrgos nigripes]|uniref:Methyltransferase domain-containing protein n=1 Tax=Tetrapyrgos nigripes TaxID=182062 RepID=A0A8H5LNT8_9AGAR|nr:hypothetical protein D9758_010663 [Tetrapyrgos nigripes]